MDIKARSKAMREILTRLVERARGGVEVKVFGDKVILDEGVLLPPLLQNSSKLTTDLRIPKTLKAGQDAMSLSRSSLPTFR